MVTIKEIATAVGVSSTTVSRVLNFDRTLSISPAKRHAIIKTAETLNYATPRSRKRAKTLTDTRATLLGVRKIALVHFLRPPQKLLDSFCLDICLGITNRCRALQIDVVSVYLSGCLRDDALPQEACGVIGIGHHTQEEVAWLRASSQQLVFAGFSPDLDLEDTIVSDTKLAMRKLMGQLHGRGYRRIGFIGWADFIDQRCQAYKEWMEQAGLFDSCLCMTECPKPDSGYRLAKAIMKVAEPPEIIVVYNDDMAIGAYRALLELGLNIPGDVGVASFNDIPLAKLLKPPLSTVRIPAGLIGEAAVDLLLERFAGRDVAKTVVLSADVMWRGSTR